MVSGQLFWGGEGVKNEGKRLSFGKKCLINNKGVFFIARTPPYCVNKDSDSSFYLLAAGVFFCIATVLALRAESTLARFWL